MTIFFIVVGVLTCVLVILCYVLSIRDIKRNAEREMEENEEQAKRRYVRENLHIFGVSERGATEMGSEQEIFVLSPKEVGILEEKGRSWD